MPYGHENRGYAMLTIQAPLIERTVMKFAIALPSITGQNSNSPATCSRWSDHFHKGHAMTARQQQGGPTIIAWSLILLALISRIAFGGLASPDNVLHSQGEQQSLLSILCEGDLPPDDGHHAHHLPATDMATLLAEAHGLDAPPMLGTVPVGPDMLALLSGVWIFPPVRGPPRARYSPLCPQGPPHLN